MALDFVINVDHEVVFSYGKGTLTFASIVDHMERLSADVRFRPHFRQIIDFRGMTLVEISNDEIRHLARRAVFGPESRRGFVVSSSLQYGLCRMFGTYRDIEGESNIRIFNEMDQAIEWIAVPTEIVEVAFRDLRSRVHIGECASPGTV